MWKWHYQRRRARERLRVWCQRPRAMQCQTMNKHVEQDDGRNSRCQEAEFQERHWKVPRRMFMPAAWRDSGILWLQMFLPVGYLTQTDPTRTIQSSNRSYLDKQPILGTPLVWCIFFYARPAGPELESGQTWKWTTIWAIYCPNWAICLKSGQNFSRSGQKKLFMLLVLTVLNATLGWGTSSNRSYINYNDKQQISDTQLGLTGIAIWTGPLFYQRSWAAAELWIVTLGSSIGTCSFSTSAVTAYCLYHWLGSKIWWQAAWPRLSRQQLSDLAIARLAS